MKPSLELFKLVKSLSKSEKRFFKLSSALQSGEKNYLKIFDYIEQNPTYDEEELKQFFEDETFVKHLPSEKNHLYKLILKSLRSYYSEQTPGNKLTQEIKNIEILYSKALYRECGKFVQRAKKFAQKYEKFYYWFELINWEKKLLDVAYSSGEFSKDLNKIVEEEETVVAKLRNLAEYKMLYSKINLIFRSGGFSRNQHERQIVEAISNHELIKGKNTALSSKAASICYYIKGLCAATNRNFEDSFQFFNRTRVILDGNLPLREDSGKRYALTLLHLLRCYIDSNEFDEAKNLIQDIRDLEGVKGFKSLDIKVHVFGRLSSLELMLLHAMGDFQTSVNLISEIEAKELKFGDKLSKEMKVVLSYYKAISFFGLGDFKKSLAYLNEILNDNEQLLRQDIYSFARLLNLLVHFELENYDFLDYLTKSTSRFLSKHEKDYRIEHVIIKYIRKLSKRTTVDKQEELFRKMSLEVESLLESRNERIILGYFNVLAWINSKIAKKSFSESVILLN